MINQKPYKLHQAKGFAVNKGQHRENNEDSVAAIDLTLIEGDAARTVGVYAVADGMGGEARGEVASSMAIHSAVQTIIAHITEQENILPENYREWVEEAIKVANLTVYDDIKEMGTTLVVAIIAGNQAYIANVGDSRAYMITSSEIHQITEDQSFVQKLLSGGAITSEQAKNHPYRNILSRSIGAEAKIKADLFTADISADSYLLLCSDGLTNELDDKRIHRIIRQSDSPQEACDELVEAANASGGHDNIAVVLVQIRPDES